MIIILVTAGAANILRLSLFSNSFHKYRYNLHCRFSRALHSHHDELCTHNILCISSNRRHREWKTSLFVEVLYTRTHSQGNGGSNRLFIQRSLFLL